MAKNTAQEDEQLQEGFSLSSFKRLAIFIKPYRGAMIATLLVVLLANFSLGLLPYLTKNAIDQAIPAKNTTLLLYLGLIGLIAVWVNSLCAHYQIKSIAKIGQNLLVDMRSAIFNHLQKLPFSYFDQRSHGKILIRVINYINTLSDLLSNGFIQLFSDVFNVLVTLGFMLFMNPTLTLFSLALLPFLILFMYLLKGVQRAAYQKLSNKQANLNAYIHESIAGMKITQSFAREARNQEIFEEVNDQYRQKFMGAVKVQWLLWPGVQNIAVMTTALIYFIGIKQIGVQISTGELVAFIAYVNNFWNPVINIGNFYTSLITATAYLERIFETLDVIPEIQDAPNAITLPPIKGDVVFQQVGFEYEAGHPIIKDINFHVRPGEAVALVGPTGAGKTTITSLLGRFYDVSHGQILIDGVDIRICTLHSLRSQMGIMLQDNFLFTGTILENIRYGRLEATKEEIIAAAKILKAHDFIMQLKDGYETMVEEKGNSLSSGQRQLIAFARTLLADPKILILDEATSNIDTQTEKYLQEGLTNLMRDRTSFVIAHRLSTIQKSDCIFYLEDGELKEKGTQQSLMAQKGAYYQLYQAQYEKLQKTSTLQK